ncbi:MAG: 2,3-bisphosphoglycerate-independent phosphoglycerate mutase [Candidatus Woesebacteria bacterium]|jgi:2,3-bisphosphoglycerate-independent phosphoglycerate mutase
MKKNKVLTIILDGWGINKAYEGNAIHLAKTPFYDKLWHSQPRAVIECSGLAVGLPDGQMGTSEVNHMTIGAGRVIFQDLVKINQSIKNKSFFNNAAFVAAFEHVKKHDSTLHIKGLMSPGGVHSHQEHIIALVKAAKLYGIKKIFIHVFTDGRDTLPKSALNYVRELEDEIEKIGVGKIASISGRYYAMDRDHNWDRTDRTFTLLTKGEGNKYQSAREAIEDAYQKGVSDEFIVPTRIEVGPGEEGTISSDDAVIFANFRNDRPRQLVERFLEKSPANLHYVTMTEYSPEYSVQVAYPKEKIKDTLGELVSKAGLKQLRITETEKFAHLTFFLNCKREEAFELEDRIMLDSYSDISTHDEKPEMRTLDIAEQIIQSVKAGSHQLIFTNLCNADMVGHTGNVEEAKKGCEIVDRALKKIMPVALKHDYHVIITSDHGNAEEMKDEETGETMTAHSNNPVPFILVSKKYQQLKRDKASAIDIAPTILKLLGLKQPKVMTGKSLV